MPFNIIRILIDLLLESYALAAGIVLILTYRLPEMPALKAAVLSKLNLIGLCAAALGLWDETNEYLLIPTNNYLIHYREQPYWHLFRLLTMVAFLLVLIVFISKNRRSSRLWTLAGILLLLVLKLGLSLESWLTARYYGLELPVSIDLYAFSGQMWWICLLGALLLGGGALLWGKASVKTVG